VRPGWIRVRDRQRGDVVQPEQRLRVVDANPADADEAER
jgi:hypothetical protein